MAICVTQDVNGVIVVVDPQPVQRDEFNCPFVVQGTGEAWSDVWKLTPEQGGQIGLAVLLVWAVAWAFRAAIKSLSIGDQSDEDVRS